MKSIHSEKISHRHKDPAFQLLRLSKLMAAEVIGLDLPMNLLARAGTRRTLLPPGEGLGRAQRGGRRREETPRSWSQFATHVPWRLSRPLDETTREAVQRAFLNHHLLVFREQALTQPQQIAFTEQSGALERHTKFNRRVDDFPLLHAITMPPYGGDTVFANMYAACAARQRFYSMSA